MKTIKFMLIVAMPEDIKNSGSGKEIIEHIRENLEDCGITDCAVELKGMEE